MEEKKNPFNDLGWSEDDWLCAKYYETVLKNEGELEKLTVDTFKATKNFHIKFISFMKYAEILDISIFKDESSKSDFSKYLPTKSGIVLLAKNLLTLKYDFFDDLIPKELFELQVTRNTTDDKFSQFSSKMFLESDKRHCYLATTELNYDNIEYHFLKYFLKNISSSIDKKSDLTAQFEEAAFVIEGVLSMYGSFGYFSDQFNIGKFNDLIQSNRYPSYVLDSFTKRWISKLFQTIEYFFRTFSRYIPGFSRMKEVYDSFSLDPTFDCISNMKNSKTLREATDLYNYSNPSSDTKVLSFLFKSMLTVDSRTLIYDIPLKDAPGCSNSIDMGYILSKQSDLTGLYGSTPEYRSSVFQCLSSISDVCSHMITLGVNHSMWMDSSRLDSFRLNHRWLKDFEMLNRVSFDEVLRDLKSIKEYKLLRDKYKESFTKGKEIVLFGSDSPVEKLTYFILRSRYFHIMSKAHDIEEPESLIPMKKLILEKVLNNDIQKPGLSNSKDLKEFKNYFNNELCFVPVEYLSYDFAQIKASKKLNFFSFFISFIYNGLEASDYDGYYSRRKCANIDDFIKLSELILKKPKEVIYSYSESDDQISDQSDQSDISDISDISDQSSNQSDNNHSEEHYSDDKLQLPGDFLSESDCNDEDYEPSDDISCDSDDSDTELLDYEDNTDIYLREIISEPISLPATFTEDHPLLGHDSKSYFEGTSKAVQAEGHAVHIYIIKKADLIKAFHTLKDFNNLLPDKMLLKLYEKGKIEKHFKSDYYTNDGNDKCSIEKKIKRILDKADQEVQLYENINNSTDTFLKERIPKLYMSGNYRFVDDLNGDRSGKFTLLENIPSDLAKDVNFRSIFWKTKFYNKSKFGTTLEKCLQLIQSLNRQNIKLRQDINLDNFSICDDGKLKIRDIFNYGEHFSFADSNRLASSESYKESAKHNSFEVDSVLSLHALFCANNN